MIRAIIFDIGGVLIDLDRTACIKAFRELLGYERITEILDASHSRGPYMELEAGRITPEEFRAEILAESRPGALPEDVDRSMRAFLGKMDPSKARLIERLWGQYDLYLLSNNNPISMPRCREILAENGIEPSRYFKAEFVSSEMKLLKPSRDFYGEVVRRIGLPPEELLFIDDSMANVEGARSVGIRAVHFVQGGDLEACITTAIQASAQ